MINDTIHIGWLSRRTGSVERRALPRLHDASVARVAMSFGKIVRKIVKKLLKRDTEPATPEPLIDSGLYEDPNLDRLSTEPCTFCAEPDGACSGDLNRNVHLSDATGFTGSYDGGHRKCVEYGFADLSSPFATESAERDSACRSSRAPAPVCVCETCYIFRSPNLPSGISKSPRIAAPATVAAGQHIADGVTGEEFCPYRQCDVSVDSRFACGKLLKSGVTSLSEMEDCGGGCRKSSFSLVSLLEPHVFTTDCVLR